MLYLDLAKNREDYILDVEEKFPYFWKKILSFFRRGIGNPFLHEVDGKDVVLISKLNKRILKKLDKIFKMDVTKTVCVCEALRENEEFIGYLQERNLKVLDGKWLFRYLVCDIAEFVCKKQGLKPEEQEVSVLISEPDFLEFETIKKLGKNFKNINVVTNRVRKFDKLVDEVYAESGLMLNVTNNFKKACVNSKIIFNFDFEEKEFQKIRFLADAVVVQLEQKMEVKQSNFKGSNIDFYTVNLPVKYKRIYRKLHYFDSSILYESFIYKRTSHQNIWNEIARDNIQIVCLQAGNHNLFF
ncbi:MAG: hypothetical protein IJ867_07185 [Clostridia bacterium]|nr:hypothetical protein [Clostridia bacterium]